MGGILTIICIAAACAIVEVIVLSMVYHSGYANGELAADEARHKQLEILRMRLRHMTEERDGLLKRLLLPENANKSELYDISVSAARRKHVEPFPNGSCRVKPSTSNWPSGVIGAMQDQQQRTTTEIRDRLDNKQRPPV